MTSTIRAKVSEAALRENTGRGWEEWFVRLDAYGATDLSHTEIAKRLGEEVDGWWSQTIAVAYEQERGMRAPGQASCRASGRAGRSRGRASPQRLTDRRTTNLGSLATTSQLPNSRRNFTW
ncbi:hypothetical protein [Nonomuraea sp. NPDC003804]|uniref:hypothetical protein n=1 Tax=Nonomuraea sp. NPDC003804 TaxID=3154547 RepID=UPI0033B05DD5